MNTSNQGSPMHIGRQRALLLAVLLSTAATAAFGQSGKAPDAVPLSRAQVVKELAAFQETHEWNAWLGEWQPRVGTKRPTGARYGVVFVRAAEPKPGGSPD
jgi:hypothetical protein